VRRLLEENSTDKIAAYQTLYTCLTVSKLGAIAPFFMDKLYRDLTLATQIRKI
jgi:isoleucyl-tRNA synthetase